MKIHLLLFITFCSFQVLQSQNKVDSLVNIGIEYHDSFKYDKAIKVYKKALKLDPNSTLVHTEMALTYMHTKEYEKSIQHSEFVIEANKDHLLHAYLSKGSCLDYLGKTEESIALFEKGIEEFGEHYLLYFNLGVNYYNLQEYNKSEEAFLNAISVNPNHASSHLYLAFSMQKKQQRVQSLLAFHYFLFLEPNSQRSKDAYYKLKDQYGGNVTEDNSKKKKTINITIDANQEDSTFTPADMMLSMLEATNLSVDDENILTKEEMFEKNTSSFFTILGELKKDDYTSFYWDFYVPFFYEIGKSEHNKAYCNYISQSENEIARHWLNQNQDALSNFATWLDGE